MKEMGLECIRNTSKELYEKKSDAYKNRVNQQFNVSRPNEVWVSDVTVIKVKGKYYYICVVLDLYARKIISYRISQRNTTVLVTKCIREAYTKRSPLIL